MLLPLLILGGSVVGALRIHSKYTGGGAEMRLPVPPAPSVSGQEPVLDDPADRQASANAGWLGSAMDRAYEIGEAGTRKLLRLGTGDERRQQLAELTGSSPEIDPEERTVRRRIVSCVGMLGLYTAGVVLFAPLKLLAIAGLAYQAFAIGRQAVTEAREKKQVGEYAVEATWVTLAVLTGQTVVGIVLVLPSSVARILMFKTRDSSKHNLNSILGEAPRFVWVEMDGVEVSVPFEQLELGDRIVVHTGESVPVDGRVVAGSATLDQHLLTGEAYPVEKAPGADVFAGTLVLSGVITITVTAHRADSAAAQLRATLAKTVDYRDVSELRGREVADDVALPGLVLGGVAGIAFGPVSALAAMTCLPGYNLVWTGPMSVMRHLDVSVEKGILIKDGRALELVSSIDTVIFDKTGTLTESQPRVIDVHPVASSTVEEVLRFAAAAEQNQSHPLAEAIRAEAARRDLGAPDIDDTHLTPGFGVQATIDGRRTAVGSVRFMEQQQIRLSEEARGILAECHGRSHVVVFVAVARQVIGLIEFHAVTRPETPEVLKTLKERGLELYIISGDHEQPTRAFAHSVGIEHCHAEVRPEAKAALIEKLQQQGHSVCYVGDGINDSVALKRADVSVSLRGASTIAIDVAQVILRDGDLRSLPDLFAIGESYEDNMDVNVLSSTVPGVMNVAGVMVFHTGLLVAGRLFTGSVAAGLVNTSEASIAVSKEASNGAASTAAVTESVAHAEASDAGDSATGSLPRHRDRLGEPGHASRRPGLGIEGRADDAIDGDRPQDLARQRQSLEHGGEIAGLAKGERHA